MKHVWLCPRIAHPRIQSTVNHVFSYETARSWGIWYIPFSDTPGSHTDCFYPIKYSIKSHQTSPWNPIESPQNPMIFPHLSTSFHISPHFLENFIPHHRSFPRLDAGSASVGWASPPPRPWWPRGGAGRPPGQQ